MERPNVNVFVGGVDNADFPRIYKTKYLTPKLPFAVQVTEPGTKYVIKWDFDLNGETITVPENCILEFDGGGLRNGTIIGDNTSIIAGPVKVFNTDITIDGTWNVAEAYTEWFGAQGDGVTDDRVYIQKTLDSFLGVVLLRKKYKVSSNNGIGIVLHSYNTLRGFNKAEGVENSTIEVFDEDNYDCIIKAAGRNITIEGVMALGSHPSHNVDYGIEAYDASGAGGFAPYLVLRNVFCRFAKKALYHLHTFMSNLYEVRGTHSDGFGIEFYSNAGRGTSTTLINCFMVFCKKAGYRVYRMSYSALISCASDQSGLDDINNPGVLNSDYRYVYDLEDCACINILNCGCEQGSGKFISLNFCQNITIQSSIFLSGWYVKPEPDSIDRGTLPINVIFCFGITFDNCQYRFSCTDEYLEYIAGAYTDCKELLFKNNFYSTSDKSYILFEKSDIYSGNLTFFSVEVQNAQTDILPQTSFFKDIYSRLNGRTLKGSFQITLNDERYIYAGNAWLLKNISGSLTLAANQITGTILHSDSYHKLTIEDCTDLVFEGIEFSSVYYENSDILFDIKRSKVTFKNCRISKDRNVNNGCLICEDSTIIFDHCVFPDVNRSNSNPLVVSNTNSQILFIVNENGTIRPMLNYPNLAGFMFYETSFGFPLFAKEVPNNGAVVWKDAKGFSPGVHKGTTEYSKLVVENGNIAPSDVGYDFFAEDIRQPIFYDADEKWHTSDGFSLNNKRGDTGLRPVAHFTSREGASVPENVGSGIYKGFTFRETTGNTYQIAVYIIGNSITWQDENTYAGKTIPIDVRRSGTTAQRPSDSQVIDDLYSGFEYYNEDINAYQFADIESIGGTDVVTWKKRIWYGLTAEDIGFVYFDTTLGRPVYASSISNNGTVTWVDSIGNSQNGNSTWELVWDELIDRKKDTASNMPVLANINNSTNVTLSSSNNTFKNIGGKLTIKPVSNSFIPLTIYAQKYIPLVIENCNEIIFVNIGFGAVYSTDLAPNYLFNIKNSKVIFKNCRFDKDRNVTAAMMNIENSEVIIDNCFYNNLSTPGVPYCTYDSVSKVQFITPKSGTTRPLLFMSTSIGQEFFDTTLGTSGKTIYASSVSNNGTATWVDATGAIV